MRKIAPIGLLTAIVAGAVLGGAGGALLDCVFFPDWPHPTGGLFGAYEVFCERSGP